jgi:template-activating factor I
LYWQNFSDNPYFEDKKITKTYVFADDGTTTINATSIKWKEGMVFSRTVIYLFEMDKLLRYFLYYVKGTVANGVNKKGSKRPLVEERLDNHVACIALLLVRLCNL